MKKILLFILVTGLTFNVTAQLKSGDKVLSLNGMYTIVNRGSGVYNNSLSEKNNSLVVGASLSFIQDNFLFGIGVDYLNEYDLKSFTINIIDKYSQHERDISKSSAILPNVYAGYYRRIIDKLYFTTNLKLSVGKIFANTLSSTLSIDNTTGPSTLSSTQSQNEVTYASVAFQPEFTYYLSKKIGLSLYPGGIDYSFMNWDTANSNLIINFNPNNWLVGLKIVL